MRSRTKSARKNVRRRVSASAHRTGEWAVPETNGRIRSLTKREQEVLSLVGAGLTSRQIGKKLRISARTVEVHRSHVMRKLNVTSLVELLRTALQHRLIEWGFPHA
jgi:DNA-binding NarL/FixJ family response regulator